MIKIRNKKDHLQVLLLIIIVWGTEQWGILCLEKLPRWEILIETTQYHPSHLYLFAQHCYVSRASMSMLQNFFIEAVIHVGFVSNLFRKSTSIHSAVHQLLPLPFRTKFLSLSKIQQVHHRVQLSIWRNCDLHDDRASAFEVIGKQGYDLVLICEIAWNLDYCIGHQGILSLSLLFLRLYLVLVWNHS